MSTFRNISESHQKNFPNNQFKISENEENNSLYTHEQACAYHLSNNGKVKRKSCCFVLLSEVSRQTKHSVSYQGQETSISRGEQLTLLERKEEN
ncbi:MAG: hypothetical protein LBR43_01000 [Spiroplasmataceae bacterium]|jgi:hypothetical protein|nr:hypothetical protein [Spiroplasmataceae bacterium]